jgi:hypothetical protein
LVLPDFASSFDEENQNAPPSAVDLALVLRCRRYRLRRALRRIRARTLFALATSLGGGSGDPDGFRANLIPEQASPGRIDGRRIMAMSEPKIWRIAIILPLVAGSLSAWADVPPAPTETCDQIRQKIGVMPAADPDLLRTLAIRRDCRFTAAEVYRAAHGDKAIPEVEPYRRHRHGHDDDDD